MAPRYAKFLDYVLIENLEQLKMNEIMPASLFSLMENEISFHSQIAGIENGYQIIIPSKSLVSDQLATWSLGWIHQIWWGFNEEITRPIIIKETNREKG